MYQTTKIPELIDPQATYTSNGQEAWRVLGIMAEFAAATERLRGVRPAVSMFGSARIKEDHPYYVKAERIARLLSDAGFAVISGVAIAGTYSLKASYIAIPVSEGIGGLL